MRLIRLSLLPLLFLVGALLPHGAAATAVNNLKQIGISIHDGTSNTIVGFTGGATFACADGSVRTLSPDPNADNPSPCPGGGAPLSDNEQACADGSVRTIGGQPIYCNDGALNSFFGDGSVRFVSVDPGVKGSVCITRPLSSNIHDGTSNTLNFGEGVGLSIIPGFQSPLGSVRTIQDGTSNTILIGETPPGGYCLGNTEFDDPVKGDIGGDIQLGDDSSFDVCFSRGRLGHVIDGSSNTIFFGDEQSNICLEGLQPSSDLIAAVSKPTPLALLLPCVLSLGVLLGRYRQL